MDQAPGRFFSPLFKESYINEVFLKFLILEQFLDHGFSSLFGQGNARPFLSLVQLPPSRPLYQISSQVHAEKIL
jgi:hypothetical protein